jgi:hypothetical protein
MDATQALSRLLEAQLRHELASWQGEAIADTVAECVSGLFRYCEVTKLDDVVSRQQIAGVIERYVIELRLSGAITELSGELSRLVFHSRSTQGTRVDEILAPASYKEFAEKLLALEGVRRELIALVAHSATFASINARMLVRSALDLLAPRVPLAPSRLAQPFLEATERLGQQLAPQLERRLVELFGSYIEARRVSMTQAIERHLLSVLQPERVRALLDEVWDSLAGMRLSDAFALLGEQDIEDFVVLIVEFWQRYRKTDFFARISSEMIDHFFGKYGQETLASLIEDIGVTEPMVAAEITGFLRPILEHAAQSGALERALRARLEPFYRSPAALSALTGG